MHDWLIARSALDCLKNLSPRACAHFAIGLVRSLLNLLERCSFKVGFRSILGSDRQRDNLGDRNPASFLRHCSGRFHQELSRKGECTALCPIFRRYDDTPDLHPLYDVCRIECLGPPR